METPTNIECSGQRSTLIVVDLCPRSSGWFLSIWEPAPMRVHSGSAALTFVLGNPGGANTGAHNEPMPTESDAGPKCGAKKFGANASAGSPHPRS
jgi:hypothetical protein